MNRKEAIAVIVFAVCVLALSFSVAIEKKKLQKEVDELKQEYAESDSLKKVAEGMYSAAILEVESSKDLEKILRKENDSLLKEVKKKDQKIWSLTTIISTFKPEKDTIVLIKDSLIPCKYSFNAYYPDKASWFINYSGKIQSDSLFGSWEFSKLKLALATTETSAGIYKVWLSGPSWLEVESMEIKTVPPKPYKEPFFRLWGGIGYYVLPEAKSINLEAQVQLRSFIVGGSLGTGFYGGKVLYRCW